MKRFFPFLLGLTLICLSFTFVNENPISPLEECEDHIEMAEESAALSLVKVCRFHNSFGPNNQNCGPTSAEIEVDPNCIGTVIAAVTVTNLHPDPTLGVKYQLPSNIEPIYFEYTAFNQVVTIGPIEEYKYVSDKKDPYNNPYHMFEAEVPLTFDVSSICPSSPIDFFFDVRLKDETGDNYQIAPHVGPNDIWYCGIFEEACGYCSLPPTYVCNPQPPGEELVFDNVNACGEFCNCGGGGGGGTGGGTGSSGHTIANNIDAQTMDETPTFVMIDNVELEMNASPNPFSNEIRLDFNKDVKMISSLQVLDMTGKEFHTLSNINVNSSSILLNTSEIPSGVYFCKALVDGKVLTKKIIKL